MGNELRSDLIAGWLVAVVAMLVALPAVKSYDFPPWDGTVYFREAHAFRLTLDLGPALESVLFAPVFVIAFAAFQGVADLLGIGPTWTYRGFHLANLGVMAVAGFVLLRSVGLRTLAASAGVVLILATPVYATSSLHVVHVFAATLYLLCAAAAWWRTPWSPTILAGICCVGIFVRREFLLLAAVVAVLVIVQAVLSRRLQVQGAVALGLIALGVLAYAGVRPENNQDVVVLCQGYEWNIAEQEGRTGNPSRCRYAFPRDFGQPDSLTDAIKANPSAFLRHLKWNVSDLTASASRLASGGLWQGGLLRVVVAGTIGSVLIVANRRDADEEAPAIRNLLWPTVMSTALFAGVPASSLIGNPHPKYLLAVPLIFAAFLVGWSRQIRSSRLDEVASRARTPVVTGALAFIVAGLVSGVALNGIVKHDADHASSGFRFGPAATAIENAGVTAPGPIAGTSAWSITTMLNYRHDGLEWQHTNHATFAEVLASPAAVIDSTMRERLEQEVGVDDIVDHLVQGYGFTVAPHGGRRDVTVVIRADQESG